jgi:hypothetical protein
MSTLSERLQAQATALVAHATAGMYQNPVWQDRFGASGRELADEHGQVHLSYLIQALDASDPGVLTGYARSLQTLLASRGMCSRHIEENFERLERAIAELVAESVPACELLCAARQALVYESGPARELQLLSHPLAEKTIDAVWSRQPGWFAAASSYASLASFESITQAERARWKGDILEHLSYLADALHADRPELFSAHALWMRDFFVRHHAPAARVEETLLALAECLPAAESASRALGKSLLRPAPRASLRPGSLRPPLSEPPPPPVPLPMSAGLAGVARAQLREALVRLAEV